MLNCTKCNRRIQMNRDNCLYCGEPAPSVGPTSKLLKCPRCSGALTEEMIDEMMLDVCHSCGGTWYDKTELEARLKRHLEDNGEQGPEATQQPPPGTHGTSPGEVKYLPCPHCQKTMVPRNFGRNSGVIVDVCGYHGYFLDAGEFEKLVMFEEQDGSAKSQELEERRAQARAREVERDHAAMNRRSSHYALARRRFGRLL
jgi:Zn-finger nucleic acid-binding protein